MKSREQIVQGNLELMKSQEEDGMIPAIFSNTFSKYEGVNRVGVRFYFDEATGEISFFEKNKCGNDIPNKDYVEATFRIVGAEEKDFFADEIIGTFCDYKLPEDAREVLHESVAQYNKLIRESQNPNKKLSYPVPGLLEDQYPRTHEK
tara:strand:- start:668 stop:1111 length:444 start_codon:yes stop_codon:yes gene_type:complete